MLIKNWKEMVLAYSVLFPSVVSALIMIADAALQFNLVPNWAIPIVVFFSAFTGRVIKQKSLGSEYHSIPKYDKTLNK